MQPEVATARCGQRPEHFKSHHKENNILDVYHVAAAADDDYAAASVASAINAQN